MKLSVLYCGKCEINIFNIFLISEEKNVVVMFRKFPSAHYFIV